MNRAALIAICLLLALAACESNSRTVSGGGNESHQGGRINSIFRF